MYSVIRHYAGAPTLADDLKKRVSDIEKEIASVPGFISYQLIKTDNGAAAITSCENRNGCDESTKRAANWLRTHMPNLKAGPPTITGGEVLIKFTSQKAKV